MLEKKLGYKTQTTKLRI